jgi:predicted pyridoxine 5'-phosphate oxidase superfamily flavin-nucleotide-binding protein
MARRVQGIVEPTLKPGFQECLREQPMAFVASVDTEGSVWASVLAGPPGFLRTVDEATIHLGVAPFEGDPLGDNLLANDAVGLLLIDFANRRRLRVNGRAQLLPDGTFDVQIQQVYLNCTKYIQARRVAISPLASGSDLRPQRNNGLTKAQQQLIAKSDTFFVASAHPNAGADLSHRGGNPGFIAVDGPNQLIWPDYTGNSMFNTLGNIEANPRVGLLFLDYETGGTLQLSGETRVIWDEEQVAQYPGA